MLSRFDEGFNRILLLVAALFMAAAVSLTFYQVVTRFIFGAPSSWSELVARAFIIWSVFIAMAVVIRRGELIAIDLIYKFFPSVKRFFVQCWVQLWIMIFLLILLIFGIEITIRVSHQTVALVGISMSWLYLAIPVGAGLSAVSLLFRLVEIYGAHIEIKDIA